MNNNLVIDYLQAIHAGIEGVRKAPLSTEFPPKLVTMNLPMVLVFAGQGETTGQTGFKMDRRNFVTEFYMSPVTQGFRADEIARCGVFLNRFMTTYLNLLEDAIGADTAERWVLDYGTTTGYRIQIDRQRPFADSGVRTDMGWEEQVIYYGFTISIPILSRWGSGLLG